MQLVTVHTAFNPADAHLVRSRLEAAGIPAVVTHELAALSMEGYAMAAGGIKVQVTEDLVEEARLILSANEPGNS